MNKFEKRYIDLLKYVLIDFFNLTNVDYVEINKRSLSLKYRILNIFDKILRKKNFAITKIIKYNIESRLNGSDWPVRAETMIGIKRLNNIQDCIVNIKKNKIEGDLIETGVWRGGATIFMRAMLEVLEIHDKTVWVADSFQGLPKPDELKYKADKNDQHYKKEQLQVSLEQVKNNFRKHDLLDNQVQFLKGWFKDTLPKAPIEKLSLLRLDGDMYESTWDALVSLYPKLSVGGYVIIDDWNAVAGCKKAVNDYRFKNHITEEIINIDWASVYWKKRNY